MSRPRMNNGQRRKDRILAIRVTPNEHRLFGQEAEKLSMTTSTWSRMWLRYGAGLVSVPRFLRGDKASK